MGTTGLNTNRRMVRGRMSDDRGFGLVEILVSMLFLVVVAVTLLSACSWAIRFYSDAHNYWRTTVQLWNRTQEVRAAPVVRGEVIEIVPGGRRLVRIVVVEPDSPHRRWEVLHAER